MFICILTTYVILTNKNIQNSFRIGFTLAAFQSKKLIGTFSSDCQANGPDATPLILSAKSNWYNSDQSTFQTSNKNRKRLKWKHKYFFQMCFFLDTIAIIIYETDRFESKPIRTFKMGLHYTFRKELHLIW